MGCWVVFFIFLFEFLWNNQTVENIIKRRDLWRLVCLPMSHKKVWVIFENRKQLLADEKNLEKLQFAKR